MFAYRLAQVEGGHESAVMTAASSAVAVGPYAATRTPRTPHPSQRSPKTTAWSSGFDAPSNRAVDSITVPLDASVSPHFSQRSCPTAVTPKSATYPRTRSAVISSTTVGPCMHLPYAESGCYRPRLRSVALDPARGEPHLLGGAFRIY